MLNHRPVRPALWLVRAVVVAAAMSGARLASGQGIVDRLKQKAQDKVNAKTDSLSDVIVDKATGSVQCLATNVDCIKRAFKNGKTIKLVDPNGQPVAAADSAKAVAAAGGVPAPVADTIPFVNYDFVPGDKVLFAEDFSSDKVGDLPARIKVLGGNFEIADYQGQRFLRSTSDARLMIPLRAPLPPKFTLEFDAIHTWGWPITVHFVDPDQGGDYNYATFAGAAGIGDFTSAPSVDKSEQLYHARIMADGEHVKVYVDGKRVANVPEAKLGRSNGIWIVGAGRDDTPFYITNIRLAASDKSLFDALNASGRVATHGVLFNTNSDAIRPESAPTLQAIADMLKQHADLRLTIEGHTDNVGGAAANQTLSEKRAAAVRQYLITNFQIDGSRLMSKGLGATKPAASNDTPEGRQQNRRVELVKM